MTTRRIEITEGKLNMDPSTISFDGWKCFVEENGTIIFQATEKGSSIRYKLEPSGFARLTIKKGKVIKTLQNCVGIGKDDSLTGVICLKGGPVEKRKAYFRGKDYENFLAKYKLNRISYQNPNRLYKPNLELYTDGLVDNYEVTGATYVIEYNKGKKDAIMCTTLSIKELNEIILMPPEERRKICNSIKRNKFFTCEEAMDSILNTLKKWRYSVSKSIKKVELVLKKPLFGSLRIEDTTGLLWKEIKKEELELSDSIREAIKCKIRFSPRELKDFLDAKGYEIDFPSVSVEISGNNWESIIKICSEKGEAEIRF